MVASHLHVQGPSFVVPREGHEGLIPRAALSIFTNLLVVPKHRYKLYATYCGEGGSPRLPLLLDHHRVPVRESTQFSRLSSSVHDVWMDRMLLSL